MFFYTWPFGISARYVYTQRIVVKCARHCARRQSPSWISSLSSSGGILQANVSQYVHGIKRYTVYVLDCWEILLRQAYDRYYNLKVK